MKPKKMDRFERAVSKKTWDGLDGLKKCIWANEAVNLLRNEHAWMMKQIRAMGKIRFAEGLYKVGVDSALEELRFRLAQRRK